MTTHLKRAAEGVLAFIAVSVGLLIAAIIPWADIGEALASMWR